MIVENPGYRVDVEQLERDIDSFCNRNELSGPLLKEIKYICKAFGVYINKCQEKKSKFKFADIIDLLEDNLKTQAESLGTGLQSDAISLYRMIPSIVGIMEQFKESAKTKEQEDWEEKIKDKERKLKLKEEALARAERKIAKLEAEAKKAVKSASSSHYGYGGRGYSAC